MIIGCDYHPRYQQIAMMDTATGELVERRLEHENEEARAFYAGLPKPARVGMEATGYGQWFERLLAEFGHELWIGHASEISAGVVRKQKTDTRDAAHLLRLLAENRFPRIWIPSPGRVARDLKLNFDPITASAPFERVDLVAVRTTKARRKGAER